MAKYRLIPIGLLLAALSAGCIDNERSLLIVAAIPLEDNENCTWSIQDEGDFLYSSGGLLDVAFPNFNSRPQYSVMLQLENNMPDNADESSQKLNGLDVIMERFEVRYEWLTNRELLSDPAYQELDLLEGEVTTTYVTGMVYAAGGYDSPGKTIIGVQAVPPDLGTSLLAVTEQGVQDWVLGLKIKMFGHTTGGSSIESNEFLYPLHFCWGCDFCPSGTTYFSCTPGQDMARVCIEPDQT